MPHSILVKRLAVLRDAPARSGEDPFETADRLLEATQEGEELLTYLRGEAGLLAMAANRLNISGDEELREIGTALGDASERLWKLVGAGEEGRQ